ncbi:MAG: NACHT domain-containing protein [Rhodospirillales bacterium]|nr:NACHT domain-containing protein [Rhodospirillales bacterium]
MGKRARQQAATPAPEEDPDWLKRDPEGERPAPPVQTRATRLPFTELEWKDFERLCCRLSERAGNVERVWSYGKSGQAQFGIDILVRLGNGSYEVWQTKRYKSITSSVVTAAIDLFLAHKWAAQAKRLVLAVACDLDSTTVVEAIEKGAARLAAKSIVLEPLDRNKLTDRLRSEPEIVDDFFDRPWTEAICPPEAMERLATRVSRFGRYELRSGLRKCYSSWVSTVDPGLPIAGLDRLGRAIPAIPIAKRYVPADILVRIPDTTVPRLEKSGAETKQQFDLKTAGIHPTASRAEEEQPRRERAHEPRLSAQRIDLNKFLMSEDRSIILGAAGSGKSTLLRILALDILSDTPQFAAVRAKYADYIPVWVPFALWVQIASGRVSPPSLEDVVTEFLQALSEPVLAEQMRKALSSTKIVLLIDGLDEASDPTAGRTVATILGALVEARNVPALVTCRPHGLQVMSGFAGNWTRVELAPLSDAQRYTLAKLWFRAFE